MPRTAATDDRIPLKVSQLTSDAAVRGLALDEFLLCRYEILRQLLTEAS